MQTKFSKGIKKFFRRDKAAAGKAVIFQKNQFLLHFYIEIFFKKCPFLELLGLIF